MIYAFTLNDLDRVRRITIRLCEQHDRLDLADDLIGEVTEVVWFNTIGCPCGTFIWRCAWFAFVEALRKERMRNDRERRVSIADRTFTWDPVDFEQRRLFNAAAGAIDATEAEALLADYGERMVIARRDRVAPSTVTRRAARASREIRRTVAQKVGVQADVPLKGAA